MADIKEFKWRDPTPPQEEDETEVDYWYQYIVTYRDNQEVRVIGKTCLWTEDNSVAHIMDYEKLDTGEFKSPVMSIPCCAMKSITSILLEKTYNEDGGVMYIPVILDENATEDDEEETTT